MADFRWNNDKPGLGDQLNELGSVVRSQKSMFRTGIEEHFYWDETSCLSAGLPRISTTTPGSFRAFYGARSTVSHPSRNGTMQVVSDESRVLVYCNSTQSVCVGSYKAVLAQPVGLVWDCRWVMDCGSAAVTSNATTTVTFTPTYGAAPVYVVATAGLPGTITAANSSASFSASVPEVSKTTCGIKMEYWGAASGNTSTTSFVGKFWWLSFGTVGW